jgi:hypothetical protein
MSNPDTMFALDSLSVINVRVGDVEDKMIRVQEAGDALEQARAEFTESNLKQNALEESISMAQQIDQEDYEQDILKEEAMNGYRYKIECLKKQTRDEEARDVVRYQTGKSLKRAIDETEKDLCEVTECRKKKMQKMEELKADIEEIEGVETIIKGHIATMRQHKELLV